MGMKRLVGNPVEVPTPLGDRSNYFSYIAASNEVQECIPDVDHLGDPQTVADLDSLCIQAFKKGYLLDRVDAYYAWEEWSQANHASWLISPSLEPLIDCKLLIEIEVLEKRPNSFPMLNRERERLRKEFLIWNERIKAERGG